MDKHNKVPLYLQLMEELIQKIDEGVYTEQQKLPSERELCEIYNLSRITVRQALQDLEREGYIVKVHGVGTFVAPKSYNQHLEGLYSFTDEMEKLGKEPTTKVLSFAVLPSDDRLARKMDLQPQEEVFEIVRLRYADGKPLMYETSYLPKKMFPDLTVEHLNESPMYELLVKDYQINITKATERFSATLIREEEADYLHTKAGQSAMLIKRSAYHHDTLMIYTNSIARGDGFAYTVELT